MYSSTYNITYCQVFRERWTCNAFSKILTIYCISIQFRNFPVPWRKWEWCLNSSIPSHHTGYGYTYKAERAGFLPPHHPSSICRVTFVTCRFVLPFHQFPRWLKEELQRHLELWKLWRHCMWGRVGGCSGSFSGSLQDNRHTIKEMICLKGQMPGSSKFLQRFSVEKLP